MAFGFLLIDLLCYAGGALMEGKASLTGGEPKKGHDQWIVCALRRCIVRIDEYRQPQQKRNAPEIDLLILDRHRGKNTSGLR